MASYKVNRRAVAHARRRIDTRQYVLDSDGGETQPAPAAVELAAHRLLQHLDKTSG